MARRADPVDAAGNVEIVGFDPRDATAGVGPATNIPQFWALTYGLDMWDDETNAFNYDNELFASALNTIKRFTDHVGVQQMESFRSSFGGWTQSPSSSFPSGVQAMIVTGYYAPGELFHSAPDKEFGVGWVPVSKTAATSTSRNVGGHPMYIPNGVTNVDAAFEFIEFWFRRKGPERHLRQYRLAGRPQGSLRPRPAQVPALRKPGLVPALGQRGG